MPAKRPIRIAGASGSVSDRRHAFASLAAAHPSDPIDVIVGDFLSEANMASLAGRAAAPAAADAPAYEPVFLEALAPALPDVARHGIRVVANAGGLDPGGLAAATRALLQTAGVAHLRVAHVDGDNVLAAVQAARAAGGTELTNLCTGQALGAWPFAPLGAQAYLGAFGIAAALAAGADIVVTGRASDASLAVGAAAWWHGWGRGALGPLANALVAGHLLECSTYVTGGNYSGFKALAGARTLGFPIGEIAADGAAVITKQRGSGGEVSVGTCSAQLLYEIQGPWYFHADVTAVLAGAWFEPLGPDRVALRGIAALPPPPTTKVGITAAGGWQAEVHWFVVGLDVAAKAAMLEAQVREALRDSAPRFRQLAFTLHGTSPDDPPDQASATVDLRVFAEAARADDLAPPRFFRPVADCIMGGYPGATFHMDFRQALPRPVFAYFPALLPQAAVAHAVHHADGRVEAIAPPPATRAYPAQQPSSPAAAPAVDLARFGPTARAPLGWVAHARSGDKGSNANVGFWTRRRDEGEWLRGLLSTERVKALLGPEYRGGKIDRFELPRMHAVHFLLHDHLDRGVNCSSSYDFLGKNVAEFLRARHVDVPTAFLARGRL